MAEWKALIADVSVKQGKKWLLPGAVLDQKLMSAEEIAGHVADGHAHFELRGRPDKPEPDSGPEAKPKKGKKE